MFYEIFTNLCNQKGLSPTATLQKLNVSTSKLTAWKNGSLPSAAALILISEFFGVTVDYLLKGNENSQNIKPEIKTEQAISDTSKELLEVFESLPMRERVKLLNAVYDFEEQYRTSGSSGSLELPMPNNPLVSQNEQKLLEVFQNFTEMEQVKIIDRIQEWLETKRRRELINNQQPLQSGSPISSQPTAEPPILNTQNKWRLTARRTDGVYESHFATPEEVKKLKQLLENPDLEEPEY